MIIMMMMVFFFIVLQNLSTTITSSFFHRDVLSTAATTTSSSSWGIIIITIGRIRNFLLLPQLLLLLLLTSSSNNSSRSAGADAFQHRQFQFQQQVLRRISSSPPSRTKLAMTSFVDLSENKPRDVETMEEWSVSCGVQRCEGFEIERRADYDEYGTQLNEDYCVITNLDLPSNSPVLFVPNEMIFASTQCREELYVQAAEEMLANLDVAEQIPQFYLFLKLLQQYELGDESPWYPWLNSLPRTFYNGASMTPYCYECLPPLVSSLAKGERTKFFYFKNALSSVDYLRPETKSNNDLLYWAYNIVYTRSFANNNGDGEVRLAPMADMFNHGTETEIDFSYDEQGNCNVYTTCDVPAGSELRMSYGDPTNPSYLFATFGFLDESSPATFCKMFMDIQPSTELQNIGLDFSRLLFYKDTGEVSEEVWDVLLYTKILASNRDVQRQFYDAHMNGDVETKNAIHQQYFLETSSALKKHVDTFLEELDELSNKALAKDPKEHPRIPLILMHNDFVRQTFMKVKEQIDPMVAQAGGEAY